MKKMLRFNFVVLICVSLLFFASAVYGGFVHKDVVSVQNSVENAWNKNYEGYASVAYIFILPLYFITSVLERVTEVGLIKIPLISGIITLVLDFVSKYAFSSEKDHVSGYKAIMRSACIISILSIIFQAIIFMNANAKFAEITALIFFTAFFFVIKVMKNLSSIGKTNKEV